MFYRVPDDDIEDLVEEEGQTEAEEDEAVLCAECAQEVTRRRYRTAVGGGFEHSFANPAGIVYQIGCFEEAEGVGETGEPSSEFSWFDGYTWQVVVCRACMIHLGWLYWSGEHRFYGLILPRLEGV